MNKTLATLLFFFLVIGSVGFLFSRWWRARTIKLVVPEVALTPTKSPSVSSLGPLLSHMQPLAADEKVIELKATKEGFSGVVRYSEEEKKISFTTFLLIPEPTKDLYLWIMTAKETVSLGKFEDGKGGLLLSGKIDQSQLPVVFIVAPKVNNGAQDWLLSGSLP